MNCLLIHQAFISSGEGGGTRHFEFGRYIAQHGDQLTVVASNLSYLNGEPVQGAEDEEVDGIRILRAKTPQVLHKSFFHRVIAFLGFTTNSIRVGWAPSKSADVIMGTSPSLFQALGAAVLAMLRRKPFLLEVRDLWPEFAIAMGVLRSRIAIFASRRLEYFLYRRATHIVVNSPAYVTYLQSKGVKSTKISLIPNGVSPEMFDSSVDAHIMRQQLGLEEKFIVTYAGAIGPANDIETIIKAAEILREETSVAFVIAGGGKALSNIKAQIEASQLKNVTVPGVMPKEKIAELLAASDACVATLLPIEAFKTTYPNKVFDYMASGKPTLLGIDGVIREVVDECEGGIYFPPGDASALSQAILELSQDRPQAEAMGNRARQFVVERFNRADQARAFHEVLHQMLAQQ